MKQQNHSEEDAALWWGKYLRDPQFRIDQEARAYGRQYAYLCQKVTGREERFRIRWQFARTLSGPLYGKVIDQNNAEQLIKSYSGIK